MSISAFVTAYAPGDAGETSVVIAAAGVTLRQDVGPARLAGAALVVGGIIAIAAG